MVVPFFFFSFLICQKGMKQQIYWDPDVSRKNKKTKLIQRSAMKRSLVPQNIWPKVQMLCGEK